MPAEQRSALWQEPLPSVELADRLRRLPLFEYTQVNELFRLARLGRQARFEAGRVLSRRGEQPRTVQFLLDGQVRSTDAAGLTEIAAPAPLAVEQVLEGSPLPGTVTATARVISLILTNDEFLALLSENVELAEGIFRLLIHSHQLGVGHTLLHGTVAPVTLAVNSVPIARGGEAAILIILAGSLGVETPDGEAATATAGDVIGMYETLGGSRFDATLKVLSPVTALRLERDSLFELLADHTDLLQGVFSILLRRGK